MVQTFSVLNCGLTRLHEVEMGAKGCWAWEAGGSGSTPGSVWLRAQPRQSPGSSQRQHLSPSEWCSRNDSA